MASRFPPVPVAINCSKIWTRTEHGYALPMAIGLGLCMITLAITSTLLAQDSRDSASLRQDHAASLMAADSGIANLLSAFSAPQNAILLGRNYDPINPRTGNTYLGADGIPKSGDEANTALDEWTTLNLNCLSELQLTPNLALSTSINAKTRYTILAYRYDANHQRGYLLLEGEHNAITSHLHVTFEIAHDFSFFPAVAVDEHNYWQGRSVTGAHPNLYFAPSFAPTPGLNQNSRPNDTNRDAYLNAIWNGSLDGFSTDNIQGTLVACALKFSLPYTAQGKVLGTIDGNRSLVGNPGIITHYQADTILLTGTETLTVDTTDGPVYLYVNGSTVLKDSAKIENIRSDGQVPQVGDFRLIQTQTESAPVALYNNSCIHNAFVYSPEVDVHLLTTGDGCPGESNSSIVGVLWAEDIENSINSDTARAYDRGDAPSLKTSNVSTGIEVPENLSSLLDLLDSADLPVFYRITKVQAWNQVIL